jgi:hypothetical protein
VIVKEDQGSLIAQQARQKQIEAGKEGGKQAGRSRPKMGSPRNQGKPIEPTPQDKHERCTNGQIAALAKTGRYKVEQGAPVLNHGSQGNK